MAFKIRVYPHYHLKMDKLQKIDYSKCNGVSTLDELFQDNYSLIPNGRYGIKYVLEKLELERNDEVYIATSSDSPYVTSCVTCTIFNHCKPSRVLSKTTKLIFIIHEFGVPHPKTKELITYARDNNIDVFEDCAHTFDSKIDNQLVGTFGDYSIFSLPKIFPVEFGGILVSNKIPKINFDKLMEKKLNRLNIELKKYLYCLPYFSKKRKENFQYLKIKFNDIGFNPGFNLTEEITPYFFPLILTEDVMKVHKKATEKKINCGIWWGRNIILLPIHPLLTDEDLDYIFNSINDSIKDIHDET